VLFIDFSRARGMLYNPIFVRKKKSIDSKDIVISVKPQLVDGRNYGRCVDLGRKIIVLVVDLVHKLS
jgi:hypothetical protein